MDLVKIGNGLFETKDKAYIVKKGISSKRHPDPTQLSVKYSVFHVYDTEGTYVGYARDTGKDLDRAIREAKTKAAKDRN